MLKKRILIGTLLAAVLLGAMQVFSLATPDPSRHAQEVNLLQNPGFEGITCRPDSEPGWCLDNWTHDVHDGTFHDNIFTPQGWVTWWRKGGDYGQPEVKTIPNAPPFTGELPRIRSGNYALMLFNFYRLQDTGVYQVVTGLEPGATVELSAYAHGWSCNNDEKLGYSCGDPWNQWFNVGIEPNGIADPFSPTIIWSADQLSADNYSHIGPVTTQVGEGGSVCVFLRSQTKWGFKYQDAYWDDASLVMTAPGIPPTNTPPPPPPTATPGPSPTPRNTPTPRPDGATVHIVGEGDTLFGIALMYGIDTDQIRELNAGSLGPNDLINVGQTLVVSLPSETPTPTPLPAPPTPEPTAATEENETPGGASICVLAYHDRNNDTFRDEETEELLPNAEFTVADASGVTDRYTSDGINEPYCFTGILPGAYRVIQNPPPGYAPSGPAEWAVALSEDMSWDLQFGNARSESPASPGGEGEAAEPPPASEENNEPTDNSTFSRVFATVAKVSGVLVLILAVGAAVLFVLNRRRM
ncbi:MAG: LysM peptidoglycan-binding domain-containing protein [Chloroflexota bacterium]|nr:LysM peptidoglycan-binding domain-containing protein [Chloroflexota bacterium]